MTHKKPLARRLVDSLSSEWLEDFALPDEDFIPFVVAIDILTGYSRQEPFNLIFEVAPDDPGRSEIVSVWCEAVRIMQDEDTLEHRTFIPCRQCNKQFLPVIDEMLYTLFFRFLQTQRVEDFLAMHRCPNCGGSLLAEMTTTYAGDDHTPAPGSVADDREWAMRLLEKSGRAGDLFCEFDDD